jgi:hypothetical protein
VKYHHLSQNSTSVSHPHDDYDEFDEDDIEVEGQKQHKLTVHCLKSGLGLLPAAVRQHVSSGHKQQYYTSLSGPCSILGSIPYTKTNLSNATLASESVNVTYTDSDNISLVQGNMIKSEINHSFSNGTIVTSLSYDSMTQGQMDTRYMTNGSVTSLKSIESVIMDQSEMELKNISVSAVKPPNSLNHIQNDAEVFNNGSVISSKSLLSMGNHSCRGSVRPFCSASDDEQDRRVICNGSVKSSRLPMNYTDKKFIIGDAYEDLLIAGSDCNTLSANGTKCCSNESGATDYEEHNRKMHNADESSDTDDEDATLSSTSMCDGEADGSDSSTTDIDAVVAEYKERIKVRIKQQHFMSF